MLCKVILCDASGEISAVAFGDAAERLHTQTQVESQLMLYVLVMLNSWYRLDKCTKFQALRLNPPMRSSIGMIYWFMQVVLFFPRLSPSTRNQYELMLENHVTITHIGHAADIPKQRYSFIPIAMIGQRNPDELVDVLGVIVQYGPAGSVEIKRGQRSGQMLAKRPCTIADLSGACVEVWTFTG